MNKNFKILFLTSLLLNTSVWASTDDTDGFSTPVKTKYQQLQAREEELKNLKTPAIKADAKNSIDPNFVSPQSISPMAELVVDQRKAERDSELARIKAIKSQIKFQADMEEEAKRAAEDKEKSQRKLDSLEAEKGNLEKEKTRLEGKTKFLNNQLKTTSDKYKDIVNANIKAFDQLSVGNKIPNTLGSNDGIKLQDPISLPEINFGLK